MKQANLEHQHEDLTTQEPDYFYGASIVTESGEEIPITEQMLQRSFSELIDAWEQAREQKP